MTQEYDNVLEAKRSLKHNINFLETMLKHLNGTDKIFRARAVWASWCIHRYINDRLMIDVQEALLKNMPQKDEK